MRPFFVWAYVRKMTLDVDVFHRFATASSEELDFAHVQKAWLSVTAMQLTQDGFTSSWSGMDAFRYSDVDATIVRTPVGVRAGTFMPLELFGRSGTVNWDADISFIPQFGDKDADFKVSGISNGHSDGMSAEFVNDWLSQAKFGMSYQGAAGSFGLYYAVEKGDVRNWSSSVNARACLFF